MSSDTKEIGKILDFWFGNLEENETPSEVYRKRWWMKDSEIDREIKSKFSDSLELAKTGGLDNWKMDTDGTLALILLFDQFSRNIFRDTSEAFSQDQKAIEICLNGINQQFDKELHPVQRAFYYMPLMHSEDMDMQEKSIECFSNLRNLYTAPQSIAITVSGIFEYAMRHYEIINRFGRYPHRNTILRRESTPEEVKFLTEPGSSF